MIKNKFILLVHDHYNPLGMVRSLGEKQIYPIVILISEKEPYLVSKSRYISKLYCVKTLEEGYKILLDNYGNEKIKPFIYAGNDGFESFLDMHYNELIDRFYFWNGGRQGRITELMEKKYQCELAEKYGFNVPKLVKVRVGDIPVGLHYPVITKSANSLRLGWKDQIFICETEKDLKNAFSKMKDKYILVQEFIKKRNELCIDGLCVNNGTELYVPLQSLYYRIPDGDYGQYFFFEPITDESFREKLKRLFTATGFSGIFSIEFLVDENGKLYFQEINFRNSTWSYAMTKCGVNLCYIYAKSVLKGEIDNTSEKISQKMPFSAMDEVQNL